MSQLHDSLTVLEDAIRRSVLGDCFESVPALLTRYAEAVEAELRVAPVELAALQARTSELLEWVGQLVQISRQETLDSQAHLLQLSGYRNSPSPQHVRADA